MKKAFNVSRTIQKELDLKFNGIIDLCKKINTHRYKLISISVFDKYLNDTEASKEISDSEVSVNKSAEREARLHFFCKKLYEITTCYKVKMVGIRKNKVKYKYFSSIENASLLLKPKPYFYSDHNRFILVLPEYEAVYFESSDFTHHLYYRNESLIPIIKDVAASANVYILT